MTSGCLLSEEPFDPMAQLAVLSAASEGAGAIASFTGIARALSATGKPVTSMFLDHHPRLTLQSMQEIAEAAEEGFAVQQLRIVHRCGEIRPGEPIVFVAASASHRRAALDAVDYMMDRLKTDALFWKREDAADGAHWIEPTEADHASRARWR